MLVRHKALQDSQFSNIADSYASIAEFVDQIMVDSPAGVIPPDRMLELLRERGVYEIGG